MPDRSRANLDTAGQSFGSAVDLSGEVGAWERLTDGSYERGSRYSRCPKPAAEYISMYESAAAAVVQNATPRQAAQHPNSTPPPAPSQASWRSTPQSLRLPLSEAGTVVLWPSTPGASDEVSTHTRRRAVPWGLGWMVHAEDVKALPALQAQGDIRSESENTRRHDTNRRVVPAPVPKWEREGRCRRAAWVDSISHSAARRTRFVWVLLWQTAHETGCTIYIVRDAHVFYREHPRRAKLSLCPSPREYLPTEAPQAV